MLKREIAALALRQAVHMKKITWREVFHEFSHPREIIKASPKLLSSVVPDREVQILQKASQKIDEAKDEWEECQKYGIEIIDYGREEYPPLSREIHCPPLLLYAWGDTSLLSLESVAIVGSRRCTSYGLTQAQRFATALAEVGLVITSGLALGIDSAAHRATLRGQGKTIAVLGSGLRKLYPKRNRKLAQEIGEKGLLLTEFPLHATPRRYNFPWRNRLISGLSRGVLVVEAGERSGSLITARWALDQNREIFSIPGPVDTPTTRGTHNLIREGAHLVVDPREVMNEVLPLLAPPDGEGEGEKKEPELGGKEKKILEAIDGGYRYMDMIEREVDMPTPQLWHHLLKLEIKGVIQKMAGNVYVRVSK